MKGIFQLRTWAEAATSVSPAVAADLPLVVPYALLTAKPSGANDISWIFGGTADLMMPDTSDTRKLTNAQQVIFGINRTIAPDTAKLNDLQHWPYFSDALSPSYSAAVPFDADGRALAENAIGWVLRLRPKMEDASEPRDAEYMTADPYLYRGELYIATFVPHTRQAGQSETCPETGDAKLYTFNPLTGKPHTQNKDHVLLRDIKITGISAREGHVYLGIQQQVNPNSWNDNNDPDMTNKALLAGGTIGRFDFPGTGSVEAPNITPDIPHLHYWRERIHR
jgi:hypothetical protein